MKKSSHLRVLSLIIILFTPLLFYSCTSKEKVSISNSQVRKIFQNKKHDIEMNECYNQLQKKDSMAEGQIEINYTFYGPQNKDITIKDISPLLKNDEFENCILKTAEKVNLNDVVDKSVGPNYEVSLTVNRIYLFQKPTKRGNSTTH